MDSIAIAYAARPDRCLTIDYGQVSFKGEIRAAETVASILRIPHERIRIDCASLGSGDLAGRPALESAPIPEWWPYRNQMLITTAAMHLAADSPTEILIGTVATDVQHADGSVDFVQKIDELLYLQEGKTRLSAPAILETTSSYILKNRVPLEIISWAHSCHVGEWACGECRGCYKYSETMDKLSHAIAG